MDEKTQIAIKIRTDALKKLDELRRVVHRTRTNFIEHLLFEAAIAKQEKKEKQEKKDDSVKFSQELTDRIKSLAISMNRSFQEQTVHLIETAIPLEKEYLKALIKNKMSNEDE
jgi:predicted transcriptional regulator